jgi:hypothetical protein
MAAHDLSNCADAAGMNRSESAQRSREVQGLVPSKTSRQDVMVNLSKPACAERRVKRLKKSVWASGHLHGIADHGHRPPVCWFVTLTYAKADSWKADHVSKAIQRFRDWCRAAGHACRYTWVGEIQPGRLVSTGKAVVHYHLLAWLPVGILMPHWDRAVGRRAAFWNHGMTNTEKAFSGVGYLMKYLSKLGELTIFPKGMRLYGIGGLTAAGRSVRSWFNLPEWVKRSHGVGEVKRIACGFVVQATGEMLEAAYSVSVVSGALILRQLRDIPERFHDGAYSTFPRAA